MLEIGLVGICGSADGGGTTSGTVGVIGTHGDMAGYIWVSARLLGTIVGAIFGTTDGIGGTIGICGGATGTAGA